MSEFAPALDCLQVDFVLIRVTGEGPWYRQRLLPLLRKKRFLSAQLYNVTLNRSDELCFTFGKVLSEIVA